jgi:hypothetical protein
VPCLRQSGYAQAGGTHFGVQARTRYFKKYAILENMNTFIHIFPLL